MEGEGGGGGGGGGGSYDPHSVEDVFHDFKGRRSALVKALTTDFDDFFQKCDPEKENLCLYGYPNGQWEVKPPVEEVPPEVPEPALGINFARDGSNEKEWLRFVSAHCDAWLLAVAFFFGARFGFDKAARKRLFTMINDLPTLYEVTGMSKKQGKDKSSISNHSSNKSKSNSKAKLSKADQLKYEEEDGSGQEEDDEEQEDTLCGACGENNDDGFWICCDICEQWFHGKCVKITPAKADHIKQYKCPSCSNKRART